MPLDEDVKQIMAALAPPGAPQLHELGVDHCRGTALENDLVLGPKPGARAALRAAEEECGPALDGFDAQGFWNDLAARGVAGPSMVKPTGGGPTAAECQAGWQPTGKWDRALFDRLCASRK